MEEISTKDTLVFESPIISVSPQKLNVTVKALKQFKSYTLPNLIILLKEKGRLLKRASEYLQSIIKILANQLIKQGKEIDDYFISDIFVFKSFIKKRVSYRARGRTDMTRRRYSKLKVIVSN